MKLGIGIDTGGTYTDAVIYNFKDNTILGTAKALTTKNDLSIGILGAIDGLPKELTQKAEIISLSTTLATNACVEGKGGRAKLIFFGGNKTAIEKYGEECGLPPLDEIYVQKSFTKFSGEIEREPDWELFEKYIENGYEGLDGVGIIEMNAMKNGAYIEKKAKEIFSAKHNIPVVCGHELFNELNSLRRGASALLNAGLFPVIEEFLAAVKTALAARDINATIVIVRSDGSMMSEKFAALRPIETLLCGPAASAIGGTKLTESKNSIIVDMGGTTTDIAFVTDGVPVTVTEGLSIGKWKTFVDGLYVKTFGLGGDSAIHYREDRLFLENYRITPLCVLAKKYPSVIENLKNLEVRNHTHFLYEHYMLVKDIEGSERYTDEEKAFCASLKDAPLLCADAAAAIGKEVYTLNVNRLIHDGVVQLCGLTSTDIMHIRGDFSGHSVEASLLGAAFAAHNMRISVDEFCVRVYEEVKRKLYVNIVTAILENRFPYYLRKGINIDVERYIDASYAEALRGERDPLLSMAFKTDYTLIGIGAPIHIFLTDVAKMLGTTAIVPKHHEVANAFGAITGSISASHSVDIRPHELDGFIVFGNEGNRIFTDMDEAVSYATLQAKEGAKLEAIKRGATGKLTVSCAVNHHDVDAKDVSVYLGTKITANAVGGLREFYEAKLFAESLNKT